MVVDFVFGRLRAWEESGARCGAVGQNRSGQGRNGWVCLLMLVPRWTQTNRRPLHAHVEALINRSPPPLRKLWRAVGACEAAAL